MSFLDTSTFVTLGIISLVIYLFFKTRSDQTKGKNILVTLKNPDIKYAFALVHKGTISHDTRLFRFQLPSSKHVLGLPIGQHIYLTAYVNGELVKRPYTPITSDDNQGYFDLLIKIYSNGKMTQYLDQLQLSHTIDVSGPAGNLIYKDHGLFDIRLRKPDPFVSRSVRRLGLIAGGTGITPIYQILNEIFKKQIHEDLNIQIWLLFANQTEEDILLREQLEELAHSNSNRLKLWYTVDRESEDWKYSKGFINETMLKEHMPPPGDDVLICICGPPPMIKFACLPNLDKLGYTDQMRYTF